MEESNSNSGNEKGEDFDRVVIKEEEDKKEKDENNKYKTELKIDLASFRNGNDLK